MLGVELGVMSIVWEVEADDSEFQVADNCGADIAIKPHFSALPLWLKLGIYLHLYLTGSSFPYNIKRIFYMC